MADEVESITQEITRDGVVYNNIYWVRSADKYPPRDMKEDLRAERNDWDAQAFITYVDGGWGLFVAMEE